MDLRDAEMSLGIQFPELFHAINNSGMMDHLSRSREWVEDQIADDMNYVWQGDFLENGWEIAVCFLLRTFQVPVMNCTNVWSLT